MYPLNPSATACRHGDFTTECNILSSRSWSSRPTPRDSAPAVLLQHEPQPKPGVRSVLLVGNPSLQLKGFDVAIAVLAAVNQVVPLHITWVCQTQPTAALVPALLGSGLRIHLHVNPSQVSQPSAVGAMPCAVLWQHDAMCCATLCCCLLMSQQLMHIIRSCLKQACIAGKE